MTPSASQPAARPAQTDAPQAPATDNTPPTTQKRSISESVEDFRHTLSEKIATKSPQKTPADENTAAPDQNQEVISEMIATAKPLTVEQLLTAPAVLEPAVGTKVLTKSPQQAKGRIADNTTKLVTEATKPVTTESAKIVSAASSPKNKPAEPATDQGQTKTEIVSPDISDKSPIPEVQSENVENVGETQTLENGAKELPNEATPDDAKVTTAGQKSGYRE